MQSGLSRQLSGVLFQAGYITNMKKGSNVYQKTLLDGPGMHVHSGSTEEGVDLPHPILLQSGHLQDSSTVSYTAYCYGNEFADLAVCQILDEINAGVCEVLVDEPEWAEALYIHQYRLG